jgi:hypothetical protein
MGLKGVGVMVDTENHLVPGVLEAEAQPPGSAEEVRRQRALRGPSEDFKLVGRTASFRMGRQADERPSHELDPI